MSGARINSHAGREYFAAIRHASSRGGNDSHTPRAYGTRGSLSHEPRMDEERPRRRVRRLVPAWLRVLDDEALQIGGFARAIAANQTMIDQGQCSFIRSVYTLY